VWSALGVTSDGTKVPLGVVQRSTHNATVCTRLVSDLAERGLHATRGVLFVIDGGKAIDRRPSQFRRVKGYPQLPALARAIEQHVGDHPTRTTSHTQ
jgi:transposase-like protein